MRRKAKFHKYFSSKKKHKDIIFESKFYRIICKSNSKRNLMATNYT